MQRLQNKLIIFFTEDRFSIATSILRVIFGVIILFNYMILYSQRHFLFSEQGYNTLIGNTLSLYSLSNSIIYFDVLYHFGIIVAVLYTVGYMGRWSSVLNYLLYFSLNERFYHIGDGGDNIMIIALFFLMFTNSTKYFTLKNKKQSIKPNELSLIFHNFAVYFILAQVLILYFLSATYQLMGESWNSGVAIYYISQIESLSTKVFQLFHTDFIYLGVILTYASIYVKFAFVFLVFNRRTKLLAVCLISIFHLAIGIGMGLYTFSLIMISLELLFFTNDDYRFFYRRISTLTREIKRVSLVFTESFSKKYLSNFKHMVYYDGDCKFCISTIRRLKKYDWFHLIVFINFRKAEVFGGIAKEELEKRMHSWNINKKENIFNGVDSFIQISKRLIPLWVLLPLLYVSKWFGIGNLLYDYIASRRSVIPSGKCNNDSCYIKD